MYVINMYQFFINKNIYIIYLNILCYYITITTMDKIFDNPIFGFTKLIEKSELIKKCIVGIGLLTFTTYLITLKSQSNIYLQNNEIINKLEQQEILKKNLENKIDILAKENDDIIKLLKINNNLLIQISNLPQLTIKKSECLSTSTSISNITLLIENSLKIDDLINEKLIITDIVNDKTNDDKINDDKINDDKQIIDDTNIRNINGDIELLDECYDLIPLNNVKKFTGLHNFIWFNK